MESWEAKLSLFPDNETTFKIKSIHAKAIKSEHYVENYLVLVEEVFCFFVLRGLQNDVMKTWKSIFVSLPILHQGY